MTITALTRWVKPMSDAESAYWDADSHAARLMRDLSRPSDPHTRLVILGELATAQKEMADSHLDAFGPDPIEWEDNRDLAESQANSATLIWIVEGAQQASAGKRSVLFAEQVRRMPQAQQAAVSALINAQGYYERAAVLEGAMYEAFAEEMGGQAAETLVGLAWCERKAGKPGRRPCRPLSPRAAKTRDRLHTVLMLCLAVVAAVTCAGLTTAWLGTSTVARIVACLTALAAFAWLSPLPLTFRRDCG